MMVVTLRRPVLRSISIFPHVGSTIRSAFYRPALVSIALVLFAMISVECAAGQASEWVWMNGSNSVNQAGVDGTLSSPGGRDSASSWKDLSGDFWLFGGYGSEGLLNDLWKFNSSTNEWTWIGGSNAGYVSGMYGQLGIAAANNNPGSRLNASSGTDSSGKLWLFGGQGNDSTGKNGFLNDLWEYNPSTNQWVWMGGSNICNQKGIYGTIGAPATTNIPGARTGASAWIDGNGNLWLFGGWSIDSTGNTNYVLSINDLWRFNPSTNEWTWISGSNISGVALPITSPRPRYGATSWTDSGGNFWLFGGDALYNDLWEFNPSTNNWTCANSCDSNSTIGVYGTFEVPAATNVPGGRIGASSWADVGGNLWLYGGPAMMAIQGPPTLTIFGSTTSRQDTGHGWVVQAMAMIRFCRDKDV